MSVRKLIITAVLVLIVHRRGARQGVGRLASYTVRRLELRRHRQLLDFDDFTTSSRTRRTSARRSRGWARDRRLRDRLRLHAELLREHHRFMQLRVRRQQPDDADGQRDDWRADWRPDRTGLPSLRRRRRRHPEEQGRRCRRLLPRRLDRLGVNVGGGAMFFFSDKFGLRGDLRYFRSLERRRAEDDFNIGLCGLQVLARLGRARRSGSNRHRTAPRHVIATNPKLAKNT